MDSILCFAAEGLVEDKNTGAITAYNILEEIAAEGFPLFIQKVGVVNILLREEGEPDEFELTLRVSNAGETQVERDLPVDFEGGLKNRILVRINGLVVNSPNQLSFEFSYEGEELGAYRVPVAGREPEIEAEETD